MVFRGGKNGRKNRARQRLEAQENVIPEICNLVYQSDGGILCLACALTQEDDFIYDHSPIEVGLDDKCSGCGDSIEIANTEEASCDVFVRLMM